MLQYGFSLVGILGLVSLAYVVYAFIIKIYWTAAQFRRMDPSLKTFITPFVGLIGLQKKNTEQYGDSHKFVKDMMKENPDQLAYMTNLGNRPFLILTDPKLIKELSLSPKKFKKFNIFKHSDKAYTQGIFFAQNDDWTKERGIISHSFNHQQLKKMIPTMNDCIQRHIDTINQQIKAKGAPSRVFNVLEENELIIGEFLVRSFFSQDAAKKQVMGQSLTLALADFTTSMFNRSRTGSNVMLTMIFGERVRKMNFSKADKDLEVLIDAIRQELNSIIDKRMENFESSVQEDFLNHYIKEMKSVQEKIKAAEAENKEHKFRPITKEEIMHQLISFYFAGIDTTGHLIAMAFYATAEFKQCRDKIIEQVQRVIPSLDDMTYENLQKLQYVGKFLNECLRMWPPAVGILNRVTKVETAIGPYTIPAGMNVGTNIIGLMHNSKYYPNPEKFDPERWNDNKLLSTEPYAFVPFSAGPRSCIGKYLALMESKQILVRFLYNFQITRTEVPLRLHAKFLYEPVDEGLILLTPGGLKQAKKQE